MRNVISALLAGVALMLGGCATPYQAVPAGYSGPTARIIDGTYQESAGKGRVFYVASIDGNPIDNARQATGAASYGRGFALSTGSASRDVPIRKLRLRLVATHVTGAPIHALASMASGQFFTVEGELDFTPEAGKVYEVRGQLSKEGSAVWLTDLYSGEVVTEKIVSK